MRDLLNYAEFCESLLTDLNINFGQKIIYSAKNMRNWGLCEQYSGNAYKIFVKDILLDEQNSEDGLINTLLHEILHTVPDGMRHTGVWKKHAKKVHEVYGYNIKRTSTTYEKGIAGAEPGTIGGKI